MNTNAQKIVYFYNTFEENSDPHFGILFDNGFVLCLCCGSWIEPDDYVIIDELHGFECVDDTLKQYLP